MQAQRSFDDGLPTKETSAPQAESTSPRSSTIAEDSERLDSPIEKEVSPKPVTPTALAWNGPDDPENPLNWSMTRKWLLTIFLSFVTFSAMFSTSLFSADVVPTARKFNVSIEVTTLETSLFIAGFALGPVIFGPLSEQMGRKRPLMAGILIMTIFHIPVAVAQNLTTVLVCRFIAGVGGSSPVSIIGGMFVDYWDPVYRGIAICGFSIATFAGPVLAPIVGGFMILGGLSWRWLGYLIIILGGTMFVLGVFIIPETHAPTLLRWRALKAYKDAENKEVLEPPERPKFDVKTIAFIYLMRPFVMMLHEPILVLMTLYMSFVYGVVFLNFSAWPISFQEERGWNSGVGALPFLSITVGVIIGGAFIVYITKTRFARKMKENNGVVVPEERLIPMMVGATLIPISLFWWAWTSNPHITWVPQVIAGIPFGCGILMIFLQGLNYLIDVYKMYANSALAGNTMCRNLVGAGFPLIAAPMYNRLGVAWATSLLAFIAVAMVPIPFLFFIYGKKIRGWSKYSPTQAPVTTNKK